MNYRQILILILLIVTIAGLTINSVSAATKTTGKIYFNEKGENKKLANDEYVNVAYLPKGSGEGYKPNTMVIAGWTYNGPGLKNYHLTNAQVVFTKKVNSKTVTSTKTFNFGKWDILTYQPKNGFKPYYTIITYKKI